MALATLHDVHLALRIKASSVDADRDEQLESDLAAVESWATQFFPQLDDSGSHVEKYFDVYENATLRLPTRDCTVTKVQIFLYPAAENIFSLDLTEGNGYETDGDGNLILRPILTVAPFEGVTASRFLRLYARVEVTVSLTGAVPAAVTKGIAYLAAGYWLNGPQVLADIREEKIGDYQYKTGSQQGDASADPSYVSRARFFLQPYMSKSRVSVT